MLELVKQCRNFPDLIHESIGRGELTLFNSSENFLHDRGKNNLIIVLLDIIIHTPLMPPNVVATYIECIKKLLDLNQNNSFLAHLSLPNVFDKLINFFLPTPIIGFRDIQGQNRAQEMIS